MNDRNHPLTRIASRALPLLLAFVSLAGPTAATRADEVAAPAPPEVDAPPPPPVPATVEQGEALAAAGVRGRDRDREVQQAAVQVQAQPAYAYSYGDPYGFTAWLNGVRAQYGLGAVGYDANLSGWAASNNAAQNAQGLGHHVMGPARRQNSGMGSMATVCAMWMASPAHQAALLDPTITAIGIAAGGAYWTYNAY